MGRYVREMQLVLTSMANIPVQTNVWDQDQTAPEPLPPPSGLSHHKYAQLMLDPYHKFLSTIFRRAQ